MIRSVDMLFVIVESKLADRAIAVPRAWLRLLNFLGRDLEFF